MGLLPLVAQGEGPTSDDFFDPGVLHEIRIVMQAGDWQALHSPSVGNEYFPCSFEWRGVVVENAGVRTRGNSTRDTVKPGLHVDFNRYSDSQTFLGLKSVELKNSAQDASMLRDRLSMLFFRRMGLAAPRDVHAKVFVNGEYSGVYVVVERIDKVFLKRQFGENDGYLYEYEWIGPYGFEYRGPDPALVLALRRSSPGRTRANPTRPRSRP